MESDYKLRDKWNKKVNSNVKPLRDYFGSWRPANLTSDALSEYIEELRGEGYSAATCNRRTQLLGQDKDGQDHFSAYVFHDKGQPIGDFRKAWATACCAAGVGSACVLPVRAM